MQRRGAEGREQSMEPPRHGQKRLLDTRLAAACVLVCPAAGSSRVAGNESIIYLYPAKCSPR